MSVLQSVLGLVLFAQTAGGSLTLTSEPGSLVVWEGVQLGRTDSQGRLHIGDIPPGGYEVAVSKEGFETLHRRVEVDSGHRAVAFQLTPVPAPASVAPVSSAPPKPPEPVPVAPSAPARNAAVLAVELPTSGVREPKASQILDAGRADRAWAWLLPVLGLAAAALLWMARARRREAVPAGPGFAAAPHGDPFVPAEKEWDGPRRSSLSFLDDLRRREAMAERGVDLPPEEYAETAIDLDVDAVRSLDDADSDRLLDAAGTGTEGPEEER